MALAIELVEKSFREVATKMDFQILEFNGEKDHVHALIEYPPKLSVSQIVNALPGCIESAIWTSRTPKT
jgi:putative transposase